MNPSETPILWLHAPDRELRDAVVLGQGLPTEKNGQPVKHFWGDPIQCGNYKHPITGQSFSINGKMLDNFVATFAQMKKNGVDVPIVEDHQEKAAKSLGYVIEAKRDGDKLMLLHQFVGDDAIRMAARNKVSLKINPKYMDGKGRHYTNAITHSALTPVPVVPDQTGFIAASRGTDDSEPVFLLAAPTQKGSVQMALTQEQVDKLHKLPGASDVTADNGIDWLLSYATTATESAVKEKGRAEKAEAKVLTLSQARTDTEEETDPRILREREELLLDRADNYRDKIKIAIDKGEITPSIAKKLLPKLDKKTPCVLLLSRSDELDERPIEFILSLFEGEKLSPAGKERTGVQYLSRNLPPDKPEDDGDPANNPLLKIQDAYLKRIGAPSAVATAEK